MPDQDSVRKLTGHDFWSNSVKDIADDDDVIQFLTDKPDQAAKLVTALDALEVTYSQIKTEAEAESEDQKDEEDKDEDLEEVDEDEE